jgi:transposase
VVLTAVIVTQMNVGRSLKVTIDYFIGTISGASLKWQRLGPYERFADMIDRHWDGIAAYCKPENKVSLGFVEGLNKKIRVFQRRAYGLRDDKYLRLKLLTCTLLPL